MEDIRLLKNLDLFKGLATLDVVKIGKVVRRVSFEKGQEIVKEGTACDSIFFVKQGSVSVMRNGKKIASIGAGEAQRYKRLASPDKRLKNSAGD